FGLQRGPSLNRLAKEYNLDIPPCLVERTFVGTRIQAIFTEPMENFTDVSPVLVDVIRINKDVVEVYDNTNVDHVCEDVVHEMLKGCRGVGKAKWHYLPLE